MKVVMSLTIKPEKPNTADAQHLIDALEATLAPHYPDASRHGYSVQKLIDEGVLFFVARLAETPVGCGGVQFYDDTYAELKRMFVRPDYRGRGIAKQLLAHLENVSREQSIYLIRLETGIHQHAAIGLYEHLGYARIAPFGNYKADPNSIFYEKRLS